MWTCQGRMARYTRHWWVWLWTPSSFSPAESPAEAKTEKKSSSVQHYNVGSFLSTFQFPHTLRRIFRISRSQSGQCPRKLPPVYNVNFHFPLQVPDFNNLLFYWPNSFRFVSSKKKILQKFMKSAWGQKKLEDTNFGCQPAWKVTVLIGPQCIHARFWVVTA